MAEKQMNEKDEKQFDEKDEKELLKHDEKVEERDALSSVVWAAILSVNTGWLDRLLASGFFTTYLPKGMEIFEPHVWSLIALGAGAILLVEVIIRLVFPNFNRHIGGTLILAAVFLGTGLGNFFGWDLVWPLVLIALGVGVLFGGLLRKKS